MKSKFPHFLLILFLCLPFKLEAADPNSLASNQTAQFTFYHSTIQLRYSSDLIILPPSYLSETGISSYYKLLKSGTYQPLLQDLEYYKNKLSLNDWLFYKLVYSAATDILKSKSDLERELLCWFILSEFGYDTRLTYLQDGIFVYVYSKDILFEIPLIKDQGRTFANLTSFRKGNKSIKQELFLLQFRPENQGRPFTFYLHQHPNLPLNVIKKEIAFSYQGVHYTFPVSINQTIVEIMKDYPYFSESQYLKVPLSSTSFNSLIPLLKKAIKGKSPSDAVQLLAAFTRSSFEYKEDKSFFGKSKPMIADEVLYYPYSDCEDRSALFYQLIKILLDLPMVAIAYDDHLTIGVASQALKGDAVWFKGKPYYVCDPTGPANSNIIGKFPQGYENKTFNIIGYYK